MKKRIGMRKGMRKKSIQMNCIRIKKSYTNQNYANKKYTNENELKEWKEYE